MYYLCKGEKVIGTCNAFPNIEDLQSRGEFLVKDNRELDIKILRVEKGKLIIKKENILKKIFNKQNKFRIKIILVMVIVSIIVQILMRLFWGRML